MQHEPRDLQPDASARLLRWFGIGLALFWLWSTPAVMVAIASTAPPGTSGFWLAVSGAVLILGFTSLLMIDRGDIRMRVAGLALVSVGLLISALLCCLASALIDLG